MTTENCMDPDRIISSMNQDGNTCHRTGRAGGHKASRFPASSIQGQNHTQLSQNVTRTCSPTSIHEEFSAHLPAPAIHSPLSLGFPGESHTYALSVTTSNAAESPLLKPAQHSRKEASVPMRISAMLLFCTKPLAPFVKFITI